MRSSGECGFYQIGAVGDAGPGQDRHVKAECRVEGGEPVIFGLGVGQAVLPLGVGFVDFGPGRGEKDLPMEIVAGQ